MSTAKCTRIFVIMTETIYEPEALPLEADHFLRLCLIFSAAYKSVVFLSFNK